MDGPEAGKALGLGFDHHEEGVVVQGALLLQVGADLGERLVAEGFIQQGAVGRRKQG